MMERLSLIRNVVLGATGLICAAYGLSALVFDKPEPFWFLVPGVAGALSAVVIWVSAVLAGRAKAEQAFDEGYRQDSNAAARFGFWITVVMYPLFGLIQGFDIGGGLQSSTVFAAMGTFTGAAFLLAVVFNDLRGRV